MTAFAELEGPMIPLSPRVVRFFLVSAFVLAQARVTQASDIRDTFIASVEGDVRISRGDGHRLDLNKPWQQALAGELLPTGCALASGKGRAEVDFEDGSAIYLAENSLLLFTDLRAADRRTLSKMTLATGTITVFLQPQDSESFVLETPTGAVRFVKLVNPSFGRWDAYLDATAFTPQSEKGDDVIGEGFGSRHVAKDQTVYFQGGELIEFRNSVAPPQSLTPSITPLDSTSTPVPAEIVLKASELFPFTPWQPILDAVPNLRVVQASESHLAAARGPTFFASSYPPDLSSDWDTWVQAKRQQNSELTAAALKASGLSTPVPGLLDMYSHGSFFECPPYGTCWEPTQINDDQNSAPVPSSAAQAAAAPQANAPSFPQTVQWREYFDGWCGSVMSQTVSRIAQTPAELNAILLEKQAARRRSSYIGVYSMGCDTGFWVRRRNRYARVITPPPRTCHSARCAPVHPPRSLWVRQGNKIGIVPPHPKDEKGHAPVNLKNGVVVPPSRSGARAELFSLDSLRGIKLLDKPPKEFSRQTESARFQVAAPEIRAHLVQEGLQTKVASFQLTAVPPIRYDFASHNFKMDGKPGAGVRSGQTLLGGISRHGGVNSFADGRSMKYANSFARSQAVAAYRGNSFGSGRGFGSSSFSGGATGRSGGSFSGGFHSSGNGGGFSGHSGGGGGGFSSGGGHAGGGSSGGGWSGGAASGGGGAGAAGGAGGGGRPH